jgi:methionyl-tRNA formyltransferase
MNYIFFGTSHFSCLILDELKSAGYIPSLIVSTEDKPKGRKLIISPTETKMWAEKNGVPCFQPKTLRDDLAPAELKKYQFDFFIVASYGKIIPEKILDLPRYKTLNVHPSLLPKLRGASPIQSAILSENETGVTIMRLDPELDHGPIVEKRVMEKWTDDNPPYAEDLKERLGKSGGRMLAEILPKWISGEIEEKEQDHNKATFCKKIEKEDGLLDLSSSPLLNIRKIRAYHEWPTSYFFSETNGKKTRVIIKRAKLENGLLKIERVVPEGRKEMDYADYTRGLQNGQAKN